MEEKDFPALYKAADKASKRSQNYYFISLGSYLILLITAAVIAYYGAKFPGWTYVSASLFLITLAILVYMKVKKPGDIWYNGRAVAESVKTRTWRFMMNAEPYDSNESEELAQCELLSDLREILNQNQPLSKYLDCTPNMNESITDKMVTIHNLPWSERLSLYKSERVEDQLAWYADKSQLNKDRSKQWFIASIIIHFLAVAMLLYRIKAPSSLFPIDVVATSASAVLSWVQAKKYNELNSSYSLAVHEIVLIKGESVSVKDESDLSDYVINSESAFSREHTQWIARKNE